MGNGRPRDVRVSLPHVHTVPTERTAYRIMHSGSLIIGRVIAGKYCGTGLRGYLRLPCGHGAAGHAAPKILRSMWAAA